MFIWLLCEGVLLMCWAGRYCSLFFLRLGEYEEFFLVGASPPFGFSLSVSENTMVALSIGHIVNVSRIKMGPIRFKVSRFSVVSFIAKGVVNFQWCCCELEIDCFWF